MSNYAPIPTHPPNDHVDAELDSAFESDNEDDHEQTPLTQRQPAQPRPVPTPAPGSYDFDRQDDWLRPPPGSPPRPSSRALPNDIGNSNGIIPTSPIATSVTFPRPNFFRRAVGAILPSYYTRVPSEDTSHRIVGGGIDNDGVFANVMAKPSVPTTVSTSDGSVHVMPEDIQKEAPPSYETARQDAVPPYWETTVHAPADPNADMIIDDLPTGTFVIFLLNMVISWFFQFIGFLLTHLLHTSHAAKYGSRAGLGLTLIQLGFYSRVVDDSDSTDNMGMMYPPPAVPSDPSMPGSDPVAPLPPPDVTNDAVSETAREWLSFIFMTIGWILLLSSIAGFCRVKRWEISIRTSTPRAVTAEDVEYDRSVRERIQAVFGIPIDDTDDVEAGPPADLVRQDEHGNTIIIPAREVLEEVRLTRDLRAAGLL